MNKESLAAAAIAAALSTTGCSGGIAINESVYFAVGDGVAEHEKCHQEQMKAMGGADNFWKQYVSDKQFACEAELSCGADPDKHFACKP